MVEVSLYTTWGADGRQGVAMLQCIFIHIVKEQLA